MNNILKNKKVLIPAIIAIIVIIVAIVIFVVMGMSEKNNKKDNSKIKFGGNETSENTTKNTTKNTVKNETKDDKKIGEGIDEFYKDAAEKFVAGYMDKDDMETFLEDCVDVKAYLAYSNINGDDSKFLDEYSSIDDDSDEIKKVTDAFKELPQSYTTLLLMVEAFGQMGSEETTENTTNTSSENIAQFSDEEKEMKLVDIEKPVKSTGDNNITSIDIKISFLGEEEKITMVFYGETVIYIIDEDGKSILNDVEDDSLNEDSDGNFSFNGEIDADDINILEE